MCNMIETKTSYLTVRLSPEMHRRFRDKAIRFSSASEVLREFVQAFLEDRLSIQPPADQKESLYAPRD